MNLRAGILLVGGGLVAGATALIAALRVQRTTDALKNAVDGKDKDGQPVMPPGAGVSFSARTTGYWPYTAREDEKQMEGGTSARSAKQIYTLEMFQAGKAPYVSVSGDYEIFPPGQRLSIDAWPGVVFRIVDTGSHFHGLKKVFRIVGDEPLDVAVDSSKTFVPKSTVTATVYPGDYFEQLHRKGDVKEIAFNKIGKPVAVGGLDYFGVDEDES